MPTSSSRGTGLQPLLAAQERGELHVRKLGSRTHGLPTRATGVIASPCGTLRAVVSDAGVVALDWAAASADESADCDHPYWLQLREELAAYFAGELRSFTVPLAPAGTPFQQACWNYLRSIPYGETRSYGEQARAIGNPAAVRAVGQANGRNPIAIVVPCHRVIGANGSLTGFGGGVEVKRWLLDHESRFAGHG